MIQRILMMFLIGLSCNSEILAQRNNPSKEETVEWIKQMLHWREVQDENLTHLYKNLDFQFLNTEVLILGISTMTKSDQGFLYTLMKDNYQVNFDLLDPDNIEITPNKITISTTNGEKLISIKRYWYENSKLVSTYFIDNTNQIIIPINGKEIRSMISNEEQIETIRVKNAFKNLIILNGGESSTIFWEPDDVIDKRRKEEIKKKF